MGDSESSGRTDAHPGDGIEAWVAETTPAERVKEVIRHAYTPVSASEVADEAQTTPKTARKHLESLSTDGFVAVDGDDQGGKRYRRSPESLVVARANRLLSDLSTTDLTERVTEMQATIREYRSTYGVDSPEELAVALGAEALEGEEAADDAVDVSVVTEWQTTQRNLAFAQAALSIDQATEHVEEGRSGSVANS
ncbi:DUF7342 family protein [Natrarchaeobaculum aegyptiacum]|uniref:Transcriptional regulator n=1 Tax=Natrarchaeobaculum aegyptiacum TaxID=745377 RepID=A0A2Z2HZB5_9EURY|nr:hypothetical protein [Natrarchaeobaculum aegyptiacum]ARS89028.1 hypothetical protein B1756_04165 [Natrarchaeobaculum aegyptiacum]